MNFTPPALSQPLGFADGDAERFPRHEVNRKRAKRGGCRRQKQARVDSPEAATTVSSYPFPSSDHAKSFERPILIFLKDTISLESQRFPFRWRSFSPCCMDMILCGLRRKCYEIDSQETGFKLSSSPSFLSLKKISHLLLTTFTNSVRHQSPKNCSDAGARAFC